MVEDSLTIVLLETLEWLQKRFQKQPPEVFYKKGALKNLSKFTRKHLYQSLFFNKVAETCNFIKKEALAQVFSREFWEIFKNI